MDKILKPHKIPELNSYYPGDKDIEIWDLYKKMSLKNPTELAIHIGSSKMTAPKTNIRNLESKLDGDWYYLLQDLLGNYIEKIKPGRTSFESTINYQNISEFYGELAHIRCGKNENSNSGVRISTCLYNNGNELQIPISEAKHFEYADYYFFENKGLFLLLNIKKLEKLNVGQKWLVVGEPTENSEKRFANYSFNTLYLLKFGCIEQYGFCDGDTIYKNRSMTQTSLKYDSKGNKRNKYASFPQIWMRGCKSTLKAPKYLAIYLSSDGSREIIRSQTIAGIVSNFTDKNGKKLTRQALSAQARTNLKNYQNNIIPQKLSLSYVGKKQFFLINTTGIKINEDKLISYLRSLKENIECREILGDLTKFLIQRSVKLNRVITKQNMSVDDYFDFIEWKFGIPLNNSLDLKIEEYKFDDAYLLKSDKNSNYYKSDVAYYTNRKRGFISKKNILEFKIEILSGENFANFDYFKFYKKIKNSFNYNSYRPLDKNKFFSYLKTIIKNNIKLNARAGP
jgi:hypothetical protein